MLLGASCPIYRHTHTNAVTDHGRRNGTAISSLNFATMVIDQTAHTHTEYAWTKLQFHSGWRVSGFGQPPCVSVYACVRGGR
jgi:hypothetical protein